MPALRQFAGVQTPDKSLQIVQAQLKEILSALTSNPLSSGTILHGVTMLSGQNIIAHGLGRKYLCVLIAPPSASASFVEGVSPDRSQWVVIVASAPCTVTLVVY